MAFRQLLTVVAVVSLASATTCTSKSCAVPGKCPSTNPVTQFFPSYTWSNEVVCWTCVYTVLDYAPGAANVSAAITAAAADALNCSGNTSVVLYLPAGSYVTAVPILLPSNVLLRGEPTNAAAKSGTSPGPLAPATLITFPDREYLAITCAWPDCVNTGVVNLDLDGGHIAISPPPPGVVSSFAVVFGNRIRNVNYKYPMGPGTSSPNVWPYVFAHAIAVTHAPNVLIGNNLLAKATSSADTKVFFIGTRGQANFSGVLPYLYDNRYGIDLKTAPGWPSINMSIDSNYVYMNGRVGIMWNSTDVDITVRGSGVRVLSNHVEVAFNTTCYSITGDVLACGSDTNENRGYRDNQQGTGSFVQHNTGHVNRQWAAFTPYQTVDGEGILQQPMDGVAGYRNVWYSNDLRGGSSGYAAYFGLNEVVNNTITNCAVNPDQQIGLLSPVPGLLVSGNVCSGNTPACSGMVNGSSSGEVDRPMIA